MNLHLEHSPTVGEVYTGLLQVAVHDDGQTCHLVKTAIKGIFLRYKGYLPPNTTVVLVVSAQVEVATTLVATDTTQVFAQPCISARDLKMVVEVCSGIGCLGVGLEEAGFEILVRSDWNRSLLDLAQQLHSSETLHGDVCTDQIIADVCTRFPSAKTLAAGISCQPYSRLGDRRHEADPRSQTLPAVLRLGFLAQFGLIILECVPEAKDCPWVQQTLKQFTKETGYCMCQDVLALQKVWPARRTRWWCILAHPAIGRVPLQPFPEVTPKPMVAHVLQQFQHCDPDTLKQLQLDLYELGKFAAFGFESNMVPWRGQMATSLHSCGNQLGGCPCGCRKYPFTEQRLQTGGLHGLLIQLLGESRCGNNIYPNFRHISPDELALLNGMYPGCAWGSRSRLALCALGQLASPLQSAWLGACIMIHIHAVLGLPEPSSPDVVLKRLMQNLLHARDTTFGVQTSQDCVNFRNMVENKTGSGDHAWVIQSQVMTTSPNESLPSAPPPGQEDSHPEVQPRSEVSEMIGEPGLQCHRASRASEHPQVPTIGHHHTPSHPISSLECPSQQHESECANESSYPDVIPGSTKACSVKSGNLVQAGCLSSPTCADSLRNDQAQAGLSQTSGTVPRDPLCEGLAFHHNMAAAPLDFPIFASHQVSHDESIPSGQVQSVVALTSPVTVPLQAQTTAQEVKSAHTDHLHQGESARNEGLSFSLSNDSGPKHVSVIESAMPTHPTPPQGGILGEDRSSPLVSVSSDQERCVQAGLLPQQTSVSGLSHHVSGQSSEEGHHLDQLRQTALEVSHEGQSTMMHSPISEVSRSAQMPPKLGLPGRVPVHPCSDKSQSDVKMSQRKVDISCHALPNSDLRPGGVVAASDFKDNLVLPQVSDTKVLPPCHVEIATATAQSMYAEPPKPNLQQNLPSRHVVQPLHGTSSFGSSLPSRTVESGSDSTAVSVQDQPSVAIHRTGLTLEMSSPEIACPGVPWIQSSPNHARMVTREGRWIMSCQVCS